MSFRCVVKFLCIFFLFVVDGGEFSASWDFYCSRRKVIKFEFFLFFCSFLAATRTNSFSTRYINDFNASSSFDRNYDDNIQRQVEKFPYQQEKAATKNDDENLEIIYPNPDDLRSRMHHEESVIKICKFEKLNELLIIIWWCFSPKNSH